MSMQLLKAYQYNIDSDCILVRMSLDGEAVPRLANADAAVYAAEGFVLCHAMLTIPSSKTWWSVYTAHINLYRYYLIEVMLSIAWCCHMYHATTIDMIISPLI